MDGVETAGNGVNIDGGWDLTTDGRAVAVALGRIFLENGYWTSTDGRHVHRSGPARAPTTRCPTSGRSAARDVAALCSYNPGTGHMFKDLKASRPTVARSSRPDRRPISGSRSSTRRRPPVEHVITAIGGASILYRGTSDGWDDPLFLPDALPWADLQFADRHNGFVVWGGPRSGSGRGLPDHRRRSLVDDAGPP